MANSDYSIAGAPGAFTPYATLAAPLARDATAATITGFQATTDADIPVGVAVLIGSEVVRLDGKAGNTLLVARGCADTIPAEHAEGTPVYFFGRTWVSNSLEYGATETVAIKPIVSTAAAGRMPVFASPPKNVTLATRARRPYLPGALTINGDPWIEGVDPDLALDDENPLVFTWAHRNRVAQAEVLVGHSEGSVSPEAGTTYRIRVYSAADGLLDVFDGIDATGYTLENEASIEAGAYLLLDTVRGGLSSRYSYRVDFTGAAAGYGFGVAFGLGFGGVAP